MLSAAASRILTGPGARPDLTGETEHCSGLLKSIKVSCGAEEVCLKVGLCRKQQETCS